MANPVKMDTTLASTLVMSEFLDSSKMWLLSHTAIITPDNVFFICYNIEYSVIQ